MVAKHQGSGYMSPMCSIIPVSIWGYDINEYREPVKMERE